MLGLGCFPLGNLEHEERAVEVVRRAHAGGARYFDTAPSYAAGASERRVGRALAGLAREHLFVATKTLERDGDAALADLEGSLERLGMDYVDCVQVHEVHDDVERLFARGGVLEALRSARERGKLRHIGLTGHRDPRWLVRALEGFQFATALVPVNPLDLQHRSFVRGFLPVARARGVGVIAMKLYAGGALTSGAKALPAGDLVRFALGQPGVSVVVPGADSDERWDQALAGALRGPLDEHEQTALIERAGRHLGQASEWYKDR